MRGLFSCPCPAASRASIPTKGVREINLRTGRPKVRGVDTEKNSESISGPTSTPGDRASWPALATIAFGGLLAIYSAVMFFAIEGWGFAVLSISQVFIAFGVLSFARHLLKQTHREGSATARSHTSG